MDNKFWLLILSLLFTNSLVAQKESRVSNALEKFSNDTASYVRKYILARKDLYIGKPLDSLLEDLPQIVDYLNSNDPRNKFICPSIILCFSSYRDRTAKIVRKEFPNILVITWAAPLNNKELPALGLEQTGGKWTQAANDYYKNKIVGNIEEIRF